MSQQVTAPEQPALEEALPAVSHPHLPVSWLGAGCCMSPSDPGARLVLGGDTSEENMDVSSGHTSHILQHQTLSAFSLGKDHTKCGRTKAVLLHETIGEGRKDENIWAFPSSQGIEIVGKPWRASRTRNKNYSIFPCPTPALLALHQLPSHILLRVSRAIGKNLWKASAELPVPRLAEVQSWCGPLMPSTGSSGDWLWAGAGEDKLSHTVTHSTEPCLITALGLGSWAQRAEEQGARTVLCCLSDEGSQQG